MVVNRIAFRALCGHRVPFLSPQRQATLVHGSFDDETSARFGFGAGFEQGSAMAKGRAAPRGIHPREKASTKIGTDCAGAFGATSRATNNNSRKRTVRQIKNILHGFCHAIEKLLRRRSTGAAHPSLVNAKQWRPKSAQPARNAGRGRRSGHGLAEIGHFAPRRLARRMPRIPGAWASLISSSGARARLRLGIRGQSGDGRLRGSARRCGCRMRRRRGRSRRSASGVA